MHWQSPKGPPTGIEAAGPGPVLGKGDASVVGVGPAAVCATAGDDKAGDNKTASASRIGPARNEVRVDIGRLVESFAYG
jgi:hypothetical protein